MNATAHEIATTSTTTVSDAEVQYLRDMVAGQQAFVRQYRQEKSHCSRWYWRYMIDSSTLRDRQSYSRSLQDFVRELRSEGRDPRPVLRALVVALRAIS